MEWSMCQWLDHAALEGEPEVLHAERLGAELLRVGILTRETDVAVQNKSGNERWWESYDERLVADVGAWAARDFDRFGYPVDLEEAIHAEQQAGAPRSLTNRVRGRLRWIRSRSTREGRDA